MLKMEDFINGITFDSFFYPDIFKTKTAVSSSFQYMFDEEIKFLGT